MEKIEYKIGGWVKCIKNYQSCLAGKYYQISAFSSEGNTKFPVRVHVCIGRETELLNTQNIIGHSVECEWVGMEQPIEGWAKKGQYAIMTEDYGPAIKGMLVKLTEPQGDGTTYWYVETTETIHYVGAPFLKYMRLAHPDEIIKQEEFVYKVGDYVLMSNYANGYGALIEDVCNKFIKITGYTPKESCQGYIHFLDDKGQTKTTIGCEVIRRATEAEYNASQPFKKPPKEDLLDEAKRRFPIGTIINRMVTAGEAVIMGNYYFEGDNISADAKDSNRAFLYHNGRWAIIVDRQGIEKLPSEIIVKREGKKRKLQLM